MATVMTPRLHPYVYEGLRDWDSCSNTQYIPDGVLENFFEIPDNVKYLWVEFSHKQFKERNGVELLLRKYPYGDGIDVHIGRQFCCFSDNLGLYRKLDKGKFINDEGMKVYVRVWYQE